MLSDLGRREIPAPIYKLSDITRISIKTGAIGFVLSTVWSLTAYCLLYGSIPQAAERLFTGDGTWRIDHILVISSLVIAPIIETIPFFIFHYLIDKMGFIKRKKGVFLISIFLYGFLLHGASMSSIGRSLGFVLMSLMYVDIFQKNSRLSAFWGTVFAHFIWNVLGLGTLILFAVLYNNG